MIGIVADDVTGANDIGIMFTKHGYRTVVYSDYATLKGQDLLESGIQVCILNTESRYDPPVTAYAKVRQATAKLKEFGCSLYFKKTCSVFRGNVGAEFDAMVDELGAKSALLVAAFPQNGRQTLHGYHFVHRRLLSESEFAQDPVNPMSDSYLPRVVQRQSSRQVVVVHLEEIREGALAARVEAVRAAGGYVLCDALDDRDLRLIAAVAAREKTLGGSSALAEFLPEFLPDRPAGRPDIRVRIPEEQGILVVAGSVTPQTRQQCDHLAGLGWPVVKLNTLDLLTAAERAEATAEAVEELKGYLAAGRDTLLCVTNSPAEVVATMARGRELNLSEVETSRTISRSLAEITAVAVTSLDLKGLVVGGGDTSAMVLHRLGITGNLVLEEIQPGLPSSQSLGEREMLLVLKSGSFGRSDFFAEAVQHLRRLGTCRRTGQPSLAPCSGGSVRPTS
ncbi:MAG: four-carbon acid sugar kinase family protein [Betaproteobacteria bacterium]